MDLLWVRGVVRNGQVVLDTALGLPDGTVVTVTDYDPADDPRSVEPAGPLPLDAALRVMTAFTGRPDLAEAYLRNRRGREAG